jgi:hypothetical protein
MALCIALNVGCGDGDSAVGGIRTADPAKTFAPLVWLARVEPSRPVGARWFIARSKLWFADDHGCPHQPISVGEERSAERTAATAFTILDNMGRAAGYWREAMLRVCDKPRESQRYYANQLTRPYDDASARAPELAPGEGYYLDLHDGSRRGELLSDRYGQATVEAPAYYESRPAEVAGEDGLRLTYWLLFATSVSSSTGAPTHEGDWQRIEVLLRGDEESGYRPDSVRLVRPNGDWRRIPWRALDRSAAVPGPRTHPVVLAGGGNHTLTASVDGDGGCFGCGRWSTWEGLEDAAAEPWYGFGGAWGDIGATAATTGPLGPHDEWASGDVAQQYQRGERVSEEQEAEERRAFIESEAVGDSRSTGTIERPATQLAPLVRLHAQENSFPIAAGRFLERSSLKWRDGGCVELTNVATGRVADRKTADPAVPRLVAARLGSGQLYRQREMGPGCRRRTGASYTATELTRPYDQGRRAAGLGGESGFYLDLLSDSHDGDPRFERRDGQRFLTGTPVYYDRAPVAVDGRPGERFTYWFLYGHSEAPRPSGESAAYREGDWKRMDILTRVTAGKRKWVPVAVRLHADGQTWDVPWSSLELHDGHPVLYSALMSHVFYPRPGFHWRHARLDGQMLALRDTAEACRACPLWETWQDVRRVDRQPWYGFGGGWGLAFASDSASGPLGPR